MKIHDCEQMIDDEFTGCCCVSDPWMDLHIETDSRTVSKPMKNTDCCGYWDYNPIQKTK